MSKKIIHWFKFLFSQSFFLWPLHRAHRTPQLQPTPPFRNLPPELQTRFRNCVPRR